MDVETELAQVRERLASASLAAREVPRIEREIDVLHTQRDARGVTGPYREGTEQALAELGERLDAAKRERTVREHLRIREARLLRTRAARGGVALPMLAQILGDVAIATPCTASWDEMGDPMTALVRRR